MNKINSTLVQLLATTSSIVATNILIYLGVRNLTEFAVDGFVNRTELILSIATLIISVPLGFVVYLGVVVALALFTEK